MCDFVVLFFFAREKFRVTEEIRNLWKDEARHYGLAIQSNIGLGWLRLALKNLNQEQVLNDGSGRLFIPLITNLKEDKRYRHRTIRVGDQDVNKEHVMTLVIQEIDEHHPLVGKSKAEFIAEIRKVLLASQPESHTIKSDEEEQCENDEEVEMTWKEMTNGVPIGIEFRRTEFDVNFHYKIRTQTFLSDPSEKVKVGHKVRLTFVFPNKETSEEAEKVLKTDDLRDEYGYTVWRKRIAAKYKYAETSLRSMLAHWLTNMELDEVMYYV